MARKRSNGEGYVRKRADGTWECELMLGYKPDGKRDRRSFYGKTKKEAQQNAKAFMDQRDDGIDMSQDYLFREWAQIWYEGHEGNVTPGTYESYKYTLRILNDTFGDRKLRSIKVADVERFLKAMTKDGKKKSQAQKCRGMLYQIFKKAQANDLVLKNPVEFVDKMRAAKKPEESKKDSFTAEEVQTLFRYLEDDRIGNTIRLMLVTGMRSQEVMALEAKHIEPDGSCIHIRQAVKMVKGTATLGSPKSTDSVRDIPIPVAFRPLAKQVRAMCDPFLWTSRCGTKPCNPSNFRKQYERAVRAVPGVRFLTAHCCRHTYISQMQAVGVDMETIQSIAGHAQMDMTKHYLHVQKNIKERAVERLAELIHPA